MELTETIESLNRQLIDLFGLDTVTGRAIWRIVWSDDQTEKRRVHFLNGIALPFPEVVSQKKYPYIKERYILEQLTIVPEINRYDLPADKLSYEALFTFEDDKRNYLPPTIGAAKFVIDTVYAALGKKSMAKYKENLENFTTEGREQELQKLQNELFGNETAVGDALNIGTGVVVPNSYETTKTKES